MLFVTITTIWFQLNKMFAFLLILCVICSTVCATPCAGTPHLSYKNLRLGLPANYSGFVSGYLPSMLTANFTCDVGSKTWAGVHGIFSVYWSSSQNFALSASAATADAAKGAYSLYFGVHPSPGLARLKVCIYDRKSDISTNNVSLGRDCLIDKQFSLPVRDSKSQIFGITWSGTTVRLYLIAKNYVFSVPNNWSRASTYCVHRDSCALQPVSELVTYNVTTDSKGDISEYKLCKGCVGFPTHVFSVPAGGEIPTDFSLSNWFVLTNSSTLLNGKVVLEQPLKINCLWPIPQLLSTGTVIYFNGSASDKRCNGFSTAATSDALRFALNVTDRVLGGAGSVVLVTGSTRLEFSCTNTSTFSTGSLPFGVLTQPYYCFAVFNKTATFVGMLPPVVREIVITRLGGVYVNGYRVLQYVPLDGVIFNISSSNGADIWTVAFASNVDVLLQVNATAMERVLYCNTPLNRVKCQQMQFELPDGFYPVNDAARASTTTFVDLPRSNTHEYLQLFVTYTVYDQAVQDPPHNHTVKFFRFNGTTMVNLTGPQCIGSTQFTTNLTYVAPPDLPSWAHSEVKFRMSISSVDCPFNFDTLNNGLSFDSLCFSLEPQAGACTLRINKIWSTFVVPFSSLYVSYKSGSKILGVNTPRVGVWDLSELVLDTCCHYNIYGMAGVGVIRQTNLTYMSGLYYVSSSGMLLGFKNATTGVIYSVKPCDFSKQVVVIRDNLVGALTASENDTLDFNNTLAMPLFYYHNDAQSNCTNPVLTYSSIGVCDDGSIANVTVRSVAPKPSVAIGAGNISIPTNFTISVQAEYLQISLTPISVDCGTYVCNGNAHCLRLLAQYVTACKTIEDSLQLSARLESSELYSMLDVSHDQMHLLNISTFGPYNLSSVVSGVAGKRSFVEDLLFDKVVTSGLGTVDRDYKSCTNGQDIADLVCAQYYNGVMVLPGVADATKLTMYTASLLGGMALGGITAAAATPFSMAVQGRLNYVALQTDVLQKNQQILANSFNAAIGNITVAFGQVSSSLQQTADAINTVASALNKVQAAVNQQGQALHQLTKQLAMNFQAISSSIEDIYRRLDGLAADAQVDRLINGRLAALNAFVTQTLTSYAEVRASRRLAQEKINECVQSQSRRYGFCGNGTHLFTIPNAAPNGIMLLHTVLVPTAYQSVAAYAGFCVDNAAFVLKDPTLSLFKKNDQYLVSSRHMYEPRQPVVADFVRISHCDVSYVNITSDNIQAVIPEYIDVNKTLEEFLQNYNQSGPVPNLPLDIFNQTYLNLSSEIALLENRSAELEKTAKELEETIKLINSTLVDLSWLNRYEQYIKWPWWVWLIIVMVLTVFVGLMLYCCLATGCCGCCSCMTNTLDFRGRNLQRYEVEKVHVQ